MLSPCVVGYKGQIGKFILNGLLEYMPKAKDIWCFDVNDSEQDMLRRIKKSEIIFLCVPLGATNSWLQKWKKHLKNKLVVEQTSLKETLHQRNKGIDLLGMHLLFRPDVPVADRRCILIEKDANGNMVRNFVENGLHCKVSFCSDARTHDILMAEQQALVHRVVLTLGKIVSWAPQHQTFIGGEIVKLANRIQQGDKALYAAIQSNPHLERQMKVFKDKLDLFNSGS